MRLPEIHHINLRVFAQPLGSLPIWVSLVLLLSISHPLAAQQRDGVRRVLRYTNVEQLIKLGATLELNNSLAREAALQLARDNGWTVRSILADGTIFELQKMSPLGMPVYFTTHNSLAAVTVSTDKLWPGGELGLFHTGLGLTLGEWDGAAVLSSHQELVGRVTQMDDASAAGDHATHVAGTLMASGVDPLAIGMAYEANLEAYDWNNDESEMATAAGNGLLLSNHSYGLVTGWLYYPDFDFASLFFPWIWLGDDSISSTEDYAFGFYDEQARAWDEIAWNAPYYLMVKSAGNDRGEGPAPGTTQRYFVDGVLTFSSATREVDGGTDGYNSISAAGVGKNVLTVGAVDDIPGGYAAPSDVVMTSFSGWGPTDDGRIKPDICGNGVGLYSAFSDASNSYGSYSGTSMAAPNVTGSLLLLQQYYAELNAGLFMRAASLKALVIHTADEAGNTDGPDYKFGWGLLNTASAANAITMMSTSTQLKEVELNNHKTYTYSFYTDGTQPLKATLCWTDSAGTPLTPRLNPTDAMLVNDLDLRIEKDSTSFYPYVLNPEFPDQPATTGINFRDNVEQVLVENPTAGIYKLTISHKAVLANETPQAFSLLVSGVSDFTAPPSIAYFSPDSGPSGETITITGSGFLNVSSVKFGGVEARHFFVESDSKILADVGSSGATGNVEVSTANGTALLAGFQYQPNTFAMTDVIVDGSANDPDMINTSTFVNWFPVDGAVEYEVYAHGKKVGTFLSGGNFWAEVSNIYFDVNDDLQYALKVRARLEDGSYTNYGYPAYSLPVYNETPQDGYMQIYLTGNRVNFVKQGGEKAEITIYSLDGKAIVRDSFVGEFYQQHYGLAAGVYLVTMQCGGNRFTQKVVLLGRN